MMNALSQLLNRSANPTPRPLAQYQGAQIPSLQRYQGAPSQSLQRYQPNAPADPNQQWQSLTESIMALDPRAYNTLSQMYKAKQTLAYGAQDPFGGGKPPKQAKGGGGNKTQNRQANQAGPPAAPEGPPPEMPADMPPASQIDMGGRLSALLEGGQAIPPAAVAKLLPMMIQLQQLQGRGTRGPAPFRTLPLGPRPSLAQQLFNRNVGPRPMAPQLNVR